MGLLIGAYRLGERLPGVNIDHRSYLQRRAGGLGRNRSTYNICYNGKKDAFDSEGNAVNRLSYAVHWLSR